MNEDALVSGLIFDLDGTLLDSLRDIADAMNAVLERNGFPVHSLESYNHHVGDGMDTLARRVLPAEAAEDLELRGRIVREMKRLYSDTWYHYSAPYEGVREMLGVLAASPVKLGVLSNKPEEFTTVIVEHFFPQIPWAAVRGARPGTPIKPAPDAALEMAGGWGLSPGAVVFVGDTSTDILTAVHAGMRSVGVTWGFRGREELEANGATWVVDRPEEIPPRVLLGSGFKP